MKKTILSLFTIVSFGIYAVLIGKSETPNPIASQSTNTLKKTSPSQTSMGAIAVSTPAKKSTRPPIPNPAPVVKPIGLYKDGSYTGSSVDAYYGYIQVQAIIKDSQLADVIFLDHPQDRGTSIRVNDYAMPILKSEAIKVQNANVNTVSGATDSSRAFRESLASALDQAKA